jgi:hypothetical protein
MIKRVSESKIEKKRRRENWRAVMFFKIGRDPELVFVFSIGVIKKWA